MPQISTLLRSSFNPRAREGRDDEAIVLVNNATVSIHAPARGATRLETGVFQDSKVSIHAPARGATLRVCPSCVSLMFQSTRPRGARHEAAARLIRQEFVSIHAPARGATFAGDITLQNGEFQSTRPRGARLRSSSRNALLPQFQSTRPRGARRRLIQDIESADFVSIHAPARGATNTLYHCRTDKKFQSTRPRGARHKSFFARSSCVWFQSTRPRGARLSSAAFLSSSFKCFNPRAREGRDRRLRRGCCPRSTFQSTRPRGARPFEK